MDCHCCLLSGNRRSSTLQGPSEARYGPPSKDTASKVHVKEHTHTLILYKKQTSCHDLLSRLAEVPQCQYIKPTLVPHHPPTPLGPVWPRVKVTDCCSGQVPSAEGDSGLASQRANASAHKARPSVPSTQSSAPSLAGTGGWLRGRRRPAEPKQMPEKGPPQVGAGVLGRGSVGIKGWVQDEGGWAGQAWSAIGNKLEALSGDERKGCRGV